MNLPFDLEKAKQGHPLITRDGKKAKFIGYIPELTEKLIVHIEGRNSINYFDDKGKWGCTDNTFDLFLYKETKTLWHADVWEIVNGNCKFSHSLSFDDEDSAKNFQENYKPFTKYLVTLRAVELEVPIFVS